MPLFQHGLETGGLSFASEGHTRFLVVPPFLQFADNSFAQHLLFQPAQPFFHRLMSFQFDLNQWVLASSYNFFQRADSSRPTSVAPSATATAVPSASASAALLARPGNVHGQISSLKFLPVKHLNGFLCFLVRTHFDKAKSPAFAGNFILHHVHRNHSPCLRKEVLQLVFKNRKREISDKQLGCHSLIPASQSMNVPLGGSQTAIAVKRGLAVSESFGSQAMHT